jgi:hypothetical protein
VIPGRREQRQLAAAAAAATASGSEVHLVGEGGGRHHPHPGAAADHAVVHPGRPGGWADAAQEAVVETGHSGVAVVAERARGGVVEVADLVVLLVVVRAAHGGEGRVAVGGGGRAVARREEGDGPHGEEVLGGDVSAGAGGVASPGAPGAAAQPLHALVVEANRLCSCGVHTRRGCLSVRAGSSPAPPLPPPLEPAADDAPPPLMSRPPAPGPAPAPPAVPVPPAPCVVMSKATARCGVMSVCVRGISSSCRRSCCSSPRVNQLASSSSLMAAASPRLSLSWRRGGGSGSSRLDSTPAGRWGRPNQWQFHASGAGFGVSGIPGGRGRDYRRRVGGGVPGAGGIPGGRVRRDARGRDSRVGGRRAPWPKSWAGARFGGGRPLSILKD